MSLVFDYTPPELNASRNPIAVVVREGLAEGFSKVACKVYLETSWQSNNFELIHTEIKDYDNLRKSIFRLETVLDSELEMEDYHFGRSYPVNLSAGSGTAPPQQGKSIRRFAVVFKEGGSADGLDLENYELLIEQKYVIKGNTQFEAFSHIDGYPVGLLSHQPFARAHLPGQQHWAWLMTNLNAANPIKVDWEAYYDGLSNESGQVDYTVSWGKFLPRGIPLHLFWNAKERAELEAMKFSFPGTEFPTIRLERKYEGFEFLREFHFDNGKGGFDQFVAYGKAEREEEFSSDSSVQYLEYDYQANADALNSLGRKFARHNIVSRMGITAELGYRNEAERDAARAILFARKAFERKDGRFLPIEITSNKLKLNPDGDYRFAMEFTYQYAFENHGLWL